jgi:hypothetical protein
MTAFVMTKDVHTIEQDKSENIFYEGNNLITRTKPTGRDEDYYKGTLKSITRLSDVDCI